MSYTTAVAKSMVNNAVAYLSTEKRLKEIQVEKYNSETDCYEIVANEITAKLESDLQKIVSTAALSFKISEYDVIDIINLVSEYSPMQAVAIMTGDHTA